jgi:hypothetical protein
MNISFSVTSSFNPLQALNKARANQADSSSNFQKVQDATTKSQPTPAPVPDKYIPNIPSNQQWYKDVMRGELERAIVHERAMSQSAVSVSNPLQALQTFDQNHDGVVMEGELKQGLSLTAKQIDAYKQQQNLSSDAIEYRTGLVQTYNFGEQLQNNYAGIAKLDNQQGISRTDIARLGGLDGQNGISYFDLMAASNPQGYSEFKDQLSRLESWASSALYA